MYIPGVCFCWWERSWNERQSDTETWCHYWTAASTWHLSKWYDNTQYKITILYKTCSLPLYSIAQCSKVQYTVQQAWPSTLYTFKDLSKVHVLQKNVCTSLVLLVEIYLHVHVGISTSTNASSWEVLKYYLVLTGTCSYR